MELKSGCEEPGQRGASLACDLTKVGEVEGLTSVLVTLLLLLQDRHKIIRRELILQDRPSRDVRLV